MDSFGLVGYSMDICRRLHKRSRSETIHTNKTRREGRDIAAEEGSLIKCSVVVSRLLGRYRSTVLYVWHADFKDPTRENCRQTEPGDRAEDTYHCDLCHPAPAYLDDKYAPEGSRLDCRGF